MEEVEIQWNIFVFLLLLVMHAGYEVYKQASFSKTEEEMIKVNKKGYNFRFSSNMPKAPEWVMKLDGIVKTQRSVITVSVVLLKNLLKK